MPVAPLLAASMLALCFTADPSTDPADESLKRDLTRLAEAAGTITDLSARFTQEKHSELLSQPLLSSGELLMRGPLIRWNTLQPAAMVTYITGKELILYDVDDAQAEAYPMDRRLAELAACPVPRIDTLTTRFHLQRLPGADPQTLRMRLTPRDPELQAHVRRIDIEASVRDGVARRLEIVDAPGDRTVFILSDVRVNPGITPERITLKLPANVKLHRPLEGKGASHAH
jgi:outer membrane lipoprotein-sorting protein